MTWLAERLARLEAPPPGPGFREELWERIGERERRAARRWRAAAIAAVAVAIASASAAGVLAFGSAQAAGTVDRTVSCPVSEVGGVNVLRLHALAGRPPIVVNGALEPRPGGFWVEEGLLSNPLQLAFVAAQKDGYVLDHVACVGAARIPLGPAGLPRLAVLRPPGATLFQECWVAARITLRLRVTFGGNGQPVSARMAIRSGAKQRPVAFFDSTTARTRAFVSPGFCRPGRYYGQ